MSSQMRQQLRDRAASVDTGTGIVFVLKFAGVGPELFNSFADCILLKEYLLFDLLLSRWHNQSVPVFPQAFQEFVR